MMVHSCLNRAASADQSKNKIHKAKRTAQRCPSFPSFGRSGHFLQLDVETEQLGEKSFGRRGN